MKKSLSIPLILVLQFLMYPFFLSTSHAADTTVSTSVSLKFSEVPYEVFERSEPEYKWNAASRSVSWIDSIQGAPIISYAALSHEGEFYFDEMTINDKDWMPYSNSLHVPLKNTVSQYSIIVLFKRASGEISRSHIIFTQERLVKQISDLSAKKLPNTKEVEFTWTTNRHDNEVIAYQLISFPGEVLDRPTLKRRILNSYDYKPDSYGQRGYNIVAAFHPQYPSTEISIRSVTIPKEKDSSAQVLLTEHDNNGYNILRKNTTYALLILRENSHKDTRIIDTDISNILTVDEQTNVRSGSNSHFVDVPEKSWFFDFVNKVYERSIITGNETPFFRPGDALTRAEAAKILVISSEIYLEVPKNPTEENPEVYCDVKNSDWFAPYVHFLYEHRFVRGYSDKSCVLSRIFLPEQTITRAETLKMLWSVYYNYLEEVYPEPATEIVFSDVKKDDWYKDVISWAYSSGIINGYPDGTFRPNATITRAEIAKIVSLAKDKL